ncbi:helix-turn-helix domain-containing protein [uncultured Tenacibaculum sp.]|uniref:helix-turn-helix domain-containing protein n=1 Tax=uncultured Tenacibaculum sp. TaxID=174713 RepID=UPI0026282C49|nr:helix-turn-helix domain-containing protein [uncultured Tenacibaculum sp.]
MSSNIRVQKICQYCNVEFTAKTTVTKYCSNNCGKNAWRKRKQKKKLNSINRKTKQALNPIKLDIKDKEFLTVNEVATLLNCTNRMIYNLINNNKIEAINLSKRMTRVKRSSIEKLFDCS